MTRLRHLSCRTEQTYLGVIRKFLAFNGNRNPAGMGAAEIRTFLSHLGVEGSVAVRSPLDP